MTVGTNNDKDRLVKKSKSKPRVASPNNESLFRNLNTPCVDHEGEITHDPTGYQELFEDYVPCRTCRGLGRVPKDEENQLVALIPLKDRRLKPRRTLLYVGLAVSVCIVTAGLLIFFLWPRDIHISSTNPELNSTSANINATLPIINFTVVNEYNMTNSNFYPVEINKVEMRAVYHEELIACGSAYNHSSLHISAKSSSTMSVPINIQLSDLKYKYLAENCLDPHRYYHVIYLQFEVTVHYSSMGREEQTSLNTVQGVSCYPPQTTTTHKPTTTTKKTTTKKPTKKPTTKKPTTKKSTTNKSTTKPTSEKPTTKPTPKHTTNMTTEALNTTTT